MKIALINPPSPFLIDEKVFPNIGLLRVGTELNRHGFDTKVIDLAGEKDYLTKISDISKDFNLYGFSSTTPQFPMVYKMIRKLQETNEYAHTVIGGAHASALSQLRRKGIEDKNIEDLEVFNNVFEGEGENYRTMFMEGFKNAGIIKNIDDVSIPDRGLIDILSYKFEMNGKPTTSIQTQRGCPFTCDFCCGREVEMYNKVRQHSPERVLEEMDYLNEEFGFESFQIYDDEVNINIGRLEQLCKKLEDRDYQFRAFIRNDQIVKHPESINYMKKAGFIKLCAGVESGSDRILDIIHKKSSYKINSNAIKLIKDKNIHYEAFMILGHPSETLDDIKLSKKWLLDNKPDDFDLNLLTPYPGSNIYNDSVPSTEFKDYGWEWNGLYFNKPRYSQEDSFYKGIGGQAKSDIRTKTLSNQDLINIRNDLEMEVREKIK